MNIRQYIRVYKTLLGNAISYEVQYRANMFLHIFLNLLWISMLFLFIESFFRFTTTLGGWQKHEVYLLSLIWVFGVELSFIFFSGILRLPIDITEGNIDTLLIKPINPLFLLTNRNIRFSSSYYLLLEIPVLVWFFWHYQIIQSWSAGLLGLFLFGCGIVIQFSVLLIINTFGFWFDRFDNINDVWHTLYEMGQYPLQVLPKLFRIAFLSFLPIAFNAYIPVSALTGRLSIHFILYTILFAAFLFLLAMSFWNFALKQYSSASS